MTDAHFGILLEAVQSLTKTQEKTNILLEDVLNLFKRYEAVDQSALGEARED